MYVQSTLQQVDDDVSPRLPGQLDVTQTKFTHTHTHEHTHTHMNAHRLLSQTRTYAAVFTVSLVLLHHWDIDTTGTTKQSAD